MEDNSYIVTAGRLIYGEHWQAPLAATLDINDRTLRRWLSGGLVPLGVRHAVAALCLQQAEAANRQMSALNKVAAAALGDAFARQMAAGQGFHLPDADILTEFEVIHPRSSDDPEIRCYDGRQLVLAMVTREAWEDYFHRSDVRSVQDHNLLSQINLDHLAPVIARRYFNKDYDLLRRPGGEYPLVILRLDDLKDAPPGMTADILERVR